MTEVLVFRQSHFQLSNGCESIIPKQFNHFSKPLTISTLFINKDFIQNILFVEDHVIISLFQSAYNYILEIL